MKKYEVRVFDLEVKKGESANDKFRTLQACPTERLVVSCDTLDEARAKYAEVDVFVQDMGRYNLHRCKVIEENEYDTDGEWVAGGDWWDYQIPEEE